jgi:membrane-bound lytic murein transglycosylase B
MKRVPRRRANRTGAVLATLMLTPLGIVATGAAPEFADAQQHVGQHRATDPSWDAVFPAVSSNAASTLLAEPARAPAARPTVIKSSVKQRVAAISQLTRFDVPAAAVSAYRSAARVMRSADPGCHLSWGVLAGIGQVESNHGRFGGSTLRVDGTTTRTILGPALNGHGVARIPDTDGGRLDGDNRWDRAVGPMQFLPSTWAVVGVDGDHDGRVNPNDIDDAALAAGVYLCASGNDFRSPRQATAAVMTYNHSASYARLVLALAAAYDAGRVPVIDQVMTSSFETTPIAGHGPARLVGRRTWGQHPRPQRPVHRRPPGQPTSHPTPPAHHRPGHHKPTKPTGPTGPPTPVTPAPVSGLLTACDTSGPTGTAVPEHHFWCIGTLVLNLGTDTGFSQRAADYNGDGTVQSIWAELQSLVAAGTPVTVTFQTSGLVATINAVAYTPPPPVVSTPGSPEPVVPKPKPVVEKPKPVVPTPVVPKPRAPKPVPQKPVATKPVATKPVVTKPVPTKPVPPTQPVATDPTSTDPGSGSTSSAAPAPAA